MYLDYKKIDHTINIYSHNTHNTHNTHYTHYNNNKYIIYNIILNRREFYL